MNAQALQNRIDVGALLTAGGFKGWEVRASGRQVGIYGLVGYDRAAAVLRLKLAGFRVNEASDLKIQVER